MPTDAAIASAGGILTIDLRALRSNYRRLRAELGTVPCAAVVKANAYGLGLEEVGPALWEEGAREFFVALPEEGKALRAILPNATIRVLAGLMPETESTFEQANLQPVLNSLSEVNRWRRYALKRGKVLPAALQVDTGMARLGLPEEELAKLANDPSLLEGLQINLLISHLACADKAEHPLNNQQLQRFRQARERLAIPNCSLANSSGIFLGREFHFDLGRPGAALYGINPTPRHLNPMRQVVRLQGKVLQVRAIDRGESVGYGAAFRAEGPTRVATIALGYADGFLRSLSQRGFGWFEGHRLPIAGRVSMDAVTLDVSSLPPERLRPGDLIDFLGPDQGVDDLAEQACTIGYEVLTALGPRFHRIYRNG